MGPGGWAGEPWGGVLGAKSSWWFQGRDLAMRWRPTWEGLPRWRLIGGEAELLSARGKRRGLG